ncbi:hypothetical protein Egran_02592 [Elaphomyces granulatus]|uniref:Uncharacterized protein n=1 Tax=Elaphomyces granulatus TaxID=519963 RepID=A0A232LZQ1_9EURO|nr:hypothetical protein Egran_02592 [Elaphomyces granulatus]
MENIESGASRIHSYHSSIMTTDSMVTVPLSDVRSSPEEADHDSRAFDLPNVFDEVVSVEDETSEPALDIRERRSLAVSRSAQGSSERDSTSDSDSVDWEKLARTEEQEPRTGPTDESTALLLARLEQENNALVTNPKSVTKESLQALEASYTPSQGGIMGFSFPQMQTTASRFLGRLWAGPNSNSHIPCKSLTLNPTNMTASRASSTVRRSPSKQSMASTLNSFESTSEASTAPTEMSAASSVGSDPQKPHGKPTISHSKDKDLHGQIEDLLMALRDLQREQADLARELQREREKREEDYRLAKSMLGFVKEANSDVLPEELLSKAEERFSAASKRISIIQTKHQLRDDVNQWKEKHGVEAARCRDLGRTIDEHEKEKAHIKEELREARNRIQDSHREKQRLERTIQELRARKATPSETPRECPNCSTVESTETWPLPGLREIKLVNRAGPQRTNFPKRTSSLGLQSVLPTDHQATVPEDSLLLELVHSKTAEAVARQELEEVKAKLDSLRRLVSNSSSSPPRSCSSAESSSVMSPFPSLAVNAARSSPEQTTNKPSSPAPSVGFFSGWTKRNVSISSATFIESK